MNRPELTREVVREWVEDSLAQLLNSVAEVAPDQAGSTPVTVEWSVADMLGHVLSWEEVAVRALQSWTGDRSWLHPAATTDNEAFNQEMAAAKKNTPVPMLIAGIQQAHQAMLATLDRASDEELATVAQAPWGVEVTMLQMIAGIVGHTLEHAHEIAARNEQEPAEDYS